MNGIIGLCFIGFSLYLLIDFIKNHKRIYDTFKEEEGIPISFYRQLIASIFGILVGVFLLLEYFDVFG